MTKEDVYRVAIAKTFCGVIAPLGAIACAVVCLGLPIVSGALGVAGMNFLRNDRLLIPFVLVCCAAFLWTFERGRRVHGKLIVIVLAFIAGGTVLGSMFLTGMLSKTVLAFGCILLTVVLMLEKFFLKRYSCAADDPNRT
jgi:hypothetical protein